MGEDGTYAYVPAGDITEDSIIVDRVANIIILTKMLKAKEHVETLSGLNPQITHCYQQFAS